MTTSEQQIVSLLLEVENHLRDLALWSDQPPGQQAMASQAPFCMDSMAFNQWLQWVFMPRINALMSTGSSLPFPCAVSPLAEIWLKEQKIAQTAQELISSLIRLDQLLSPTVH